MTLSVLWIPDPIQWIMVMFSKDRPHNSDLVTFFAGLKVCGFIIWLTPVLGRLKQEYCYTFDAFLGCTVNLGIA